jgi:hypothetical protein
VDAGEAGNSLCSCVFGNSCNTYQHLVLLAAGSGRIQGGRNRPGTPWWMQVGCCSFVV